jgi:hypothetical protein
MGKEIIINGTGFEISYEELYDILNYITDEFPELLYDIESPLQSSLIDTNDNNSFIITFSQDSESLLDLPVLYYIEPKIFELISYVNSQLGAYGLYISESDFGQSDCNYELVVSKIGHKPKNKKRYNENLSKTLKNEMKFIRLFEEFIQNQIPFLQEKT